MPNVEMTPEIANQIQLAMRKIVKILDKEERRTPGISLDIMSNSFAMALMINEVTPAQMQELFALIKTICEFSHSAARQGKVH